VILSLPGQARAALGRRAVLALVLVCVPGSINLALTLAPLLLALGALRPQARASASPARCV
jgi:hypothetical protein